MGFLEIEPYSERSHKSRLKQDALGVRKNSAMSRGAFERFHMIAATVLWQVVAGAGRVQQMSDKYCSHMSLLHIRSL